MSFANLKRNSASNFEKLNQELSKLNQKDNTGDDRLWKLAVDKAGNGFAVIRFLPPKDGETPFIRIWNHSFKGPSGLWYIENSLSTFGEPDPVGEQNSVLWNTGLDSDKAIARERKRKLKFYSNIYVVKDPANPENEGKVFLYSYGKKIFDKLNDVMNPVEDPLDPKEPINPFDLWEGANFKLKQRKVEDWPNYEKSEFEKPAPLSDDDSELEEIYNQVYSLNDLLDRKNFKTYDELKAKFEKVISGNSTSSKKQYAEADERKEAPVLKEKSAPIQSVVDDDDDDDLSFFKNIANSDD